MDPPGHTRLRRLSAQAFTVRRIAALRPRIQEIADDLLRAMTGHGPPADLVEEFAFPLPTAVICELLGVPFAGRERLLLRVALEDVELGGVLVRRGEAVLAHVGAANRDENVFPDAAAFDIRRKAAPQLGFGHGVHFCLGAALARLEGEIALRTLVDRLPGLDLAVPPESIAWRPPLSVRGPEEVPVTWAV